MPPVPMRLLAGAGPSRVHSCRGSRSPRAAMITKSDTVSAVRVGAPEQRLHRFWGRVDRRYNSLISEHARGRTLDVGCGYGTLTAALAERPGVGATGVDVSEDTVA